MVPIILVVDDEPFILAAAEKMLSDEYHIVTAASSEDAIEKLKYTKPNLILLDIHMPGMDGFEMLKFLKGDEEYEDIPVIFLTGDDDEDTEVQGLNCGADDFIRKPFRQKILKSRIDRTIKLIRLQQDLKSEVEIQSAKAEERRTQMEQQSMHMSYTLAATIDSRDLYNKNHSEHVSDYSVIIGRQMGFNSDEISKLQYAAMLHDIGMISVPESFINKMGVLSEYEYTSVKEHTVYGAEILSSVSTVEGVDKVALYHHERYDGTGYPEGLKGEDIPIMARIVTLADSYDAMTSERPYRAALTPEEIIDEIEEQKGKQFDPEIADVVIQLIKDGKMIASDEEELDISDILDDSGLVLKKVMETVGTDREELDFLTGLPLRGRGESLASKAMNEAGGCLCFIDCDNLKHVNEALGHMSGDYCIKEVGRLLKEEFPDDIVYRMGGDEFIVYLKNADRDKAEAEIKRLLKEFEKIRSDDIEIKQISLSIGMCMTNVEDFYQEILRRADKALEFVKHNGKSGYCFYNPEPDKLTDSTDDKLSEILENIRVDGKYEGAMDLNYKEFAKHFTYLSNLNERFGHNFQLVLITMGSSDGVDVDIERIEKLMRNLEKCVRRHIRVVDVCTRFSPTQYLVLMLGAEKRDVPIAMSRIFESFRENNPESVLEPRFNLVQD